MTLAEVLKDLKEGTSLPSVSTPSFQSLLSDTTHFPLIGQRVESLQSTTLAGAMYDLHGLDLLCPLGLDDPHGRPIAAADLTVERVLCCHLFGEENKDQPRLVK